MMKDHRGWGARAGHTRLHENDVEAGKAPEAPSVRKLYSVAKPWTKTIAAGLVCQVLSVLMELYPPLVWKTVVDDGIVNGHARWRFISWQLVILVACYGFGQLFGAIRANLMERAGQQLTLELRLRLYEKLQRQSAGYYATRRTGDLLSRITSDVDAVQNLLVQGTDNVLGAGMRVFGVACIFIFLLPAFGLILLIPMVVVFVLLLHFNKRVKPIYRAAREKLGELTAKLADNISGIRVIQAFAQEEHEMNNVRSLGNSLLKEQVAAVKLRTRIFPAIRWLGNCSNALMLGMGVYYVVQGKLTLGALLAYRGYGRYFYGPIDELASINDTVQRATASGTRIFAVLDDVEAIRNDDEPVPMKTPVSGHIEFRDITFGYDSARPVLRNVSIDFAAGQRVAILGQSGAGKTTMMSLVARMWDPAEGAVLVDGVDVRQLDLRSLRSKVGQVQQETFVFNASAMENIRYGNPSASDEEVYAAAKAANAHDFLSKLPRGYETVLGERGVRLSGGQKQRLAIARALILNPPIMLLDEPTSAVEPESESLIISALETLMSSRTTLVVSHRLALALSADRVLVVRDGSIVEDGHPKDLLARDGVFAGMVRADSSTFGLGTLTLPSVDA